jgi:hypothetical protein
VRLGRKEGGVEGCRARRDRGREGGSGRGSLAAAAAAAAAAGKKTRVLHTHVEALERDAKHDRALLEADLEVLDGGLLPLARQRIADL